MGKRVTIQDIADELGLSRNTVSKALNNSEGLAEATRTRIIQKAMEMGYKQFAFTHTIIERQALGDQLTIAVGEKREIALLSTTYLATPHFSSLMLDALQRELAQLGYTLNAHRVSEGDIAALELPITFDQNHIAAIICIEMFDPTYDEMLCKLGIPLLFVDTPAHPHGETLPADQLYMENMTQILRLVNDMLAAGRKRIGFIGEWEHCQSFYERYLAFRVGMAMEGEEVEERFCIKYNFEKEVKEELAKLDELPDLFICANDFVAIDALMALRSLGYDVPKDVALAGFDDSAESRRCMPPLTTIHIHTQIMAYTAVQLLTSRIKEPSLDYRRVYTETELVYRASTMQI